MDLKALKAKFSALTSTIAGAIKAEDLDKAEELQAEAETVQRQIEVLEKQEAMVAKVAEMEKADTDTADAERQAAIKTEVERQVAEVTKKLGVKRPTYTGDGEPQVLTNARGPFDSVDPFQLALGYQVMKAAQAMGKPPPSLEYRRALHGRAAGVAQKGFAPMLRPDADSPAAKFYEQRGASHLTAPICYHYQADERVQKALAVKADELMGSDVSSAGDEWVPVFYSRELFRLIRNEAMVASLFRQVEVAGESLVFPIQTGAVTWYRTPQTDDAAEMVYSNAFITSRISQVATSNMTLTPGKLSAIIIWTGELSEQSLVPMLPFLQQELVDSGREVLDEIILSGDETSGATNISDYANGSISTYWRMLILDGLRHHAIVENSGNNATDLGALTAEDFLAVKKLMGTNGKNALNPNKITWLLDVALYYKMQALGEALTLDKAGPAYTFGSGVLERIWGSVVVPSDQFGATDASGYIHNTTGGNVKGSMLCVRPDQGVIGFGRRMAVETSRIARADAYEIVAHLALDFDLASLEAVACGYNITV